MVTDEMVEKACLAYWGDKNMTSMFKGKTREGVESSMRAAIEAALSTDAEPDGWICEDEFTLEPDKAWEWEDRGLSPKPFYFSPKQNAEPVKTAPAVAVKAIETVWKYSLVIESSVRRGDGPDQYAGVTEALRLVKEARSALSAQVQDVAETLVTYYRRQIEWSRETFGPALRTKGIIDHITKELREIEADPHDLSEWVDVVILAMDGFWRHGGSAEDLFKALIAKQKKNMARTWPDWRTMSEDSAIEHDRSKDAASPAPKHGDAE